MQLKSFIARVTNGRQVGTRCSAWCSTTARRIKSVEVKVDDGPWQPATMDPATSGKYSWKLFTYAWNGATPGEHTLVSRVTDVERARCSRRRRNWRTRRSFLEDNSQFPRKVMVA